MIKIIRTIILLIVIVIVFNSCCKSKECQCREQWGEYVEDCTPKSYGPYPLGGAKDYLYFKPGSYWIYKNSYTGELDSLYMAYCDTFVKTTKGMNYKWLDITYTVIDFKLVSDILKTSYRTYSTPYYPDNNNVEKDGYIYTQFCEMYAYPNGTGLVSGDIFHYPFPNHNIPKLFEYHNQIKWSDSTFYDVGVFYTDEYSKHLIRAPKNVSGGCNPATQGKIYWGKNVGIIAMEDSIYLYSSQTLKYSRWELIRYHLEK